MNILAIIPARGNSKGIPRKNVRLMNNKPLIYYAIKNAKQCPYITDIVVSTEDEEIASVSKLYDIQVIERDKNLADDKTTLDPVIFDTVTKVEEKNNKKYDIVVTLQATSPTLKSMTLTNAIEVFIKNQFDTLISAVNNPHLAWTKDAQYNFSPLYTKRLNRQELPFHYQETGAFLITRREFLTKDSRVAKRINIYEISEEEAIDIDTKYDWIVCEQILTKKRIVFRADGNKIIGMGHIYHCLTLACNLIGHDIIFVTRNDCKEGLIKLHNCNMPIITINDDSDFFTFLQKNKYDIVINDCLDTTAEYIKRLKSLVERVICIEDMGKGIKYADIVINALYECKIKQDNLFTGENYVCLRDEFMYSTPKPFQENVGKIIVTFGGTDPLNMTKIVYNILPNIHKKYPKIQFDIVTGIGYDYNKNNIVTIADSNITVFNDCKFISRIMREADLAISSQGRTMYELASLGIPSILMAQNEREVLHHFGQMKNGFFSLGKGDHIGPETLENTIEWLINTPKIREEMRSNMLKHDLKKGIQRELDLVLGH
jgi:CMP-N-acetylneuraminic acid synthetase/spore coat polysaccharide biosynthesis predicted glycosyltransferase SpsG